VTRSMVHGSLAEGSEPADEEELSLIDWFVVDGRR
jgi:hypothetical protein